MIDSGASDNYVSQRIVPFAESISSVKGRTVETAGGDTIAIEKEIDITLCLQGFQDTITAQVFDSKFDIILGRTWLRRIQPSADWTNDNWLITKANQVHTIKPITPSSVTPELNYLLSAKQTEKLIRHDQAECFLVHFSADVINNTLPASWQLLLNNFKQVFQDTLPGLPPKREVQHVIETGDAKPVTRPPYKMSPLELDELQKQLKELLSLGLIQPSTSPWGAPVLFVKKKNGSMRMCIDYRALNKVTLRNKYPLPRIDECLERLQGASHFTTLDLVSGYHQIRIQPSDVPKTAFSTRYGHYEFLVLPFGLTNAPPTFQNLTNDVLRDYLDKFVIVYLDDILIFNKDEREHQRHVQMVLEKLKDAKLIVNRQKCSFNQTELEFVGFKVSSAGILPCNSKTKAIQQWATPTNVQEVDNLLDWLNTTDVLFLASPA
jgi:hypothetical protein